MQINSLPSLRNLGGRWLRERREAAGLSQKDLANRIGIDQASFISQIELGKGRLPPERYAAFADAIGMSRHEFTMTMLFYNEPSIYNLLQSKEGAETENPSFKELNARISILEQWINRPHG